MHPETHRDILMHANETWPDIADLDFDGLATGRIQLNDSEGIGFPIPANVEIFVDTF